MSDQNHQNEGSGGLLMRLWKFIATPSAKYSLGAITAVAFVGGIVFWGGFNWTMELTNTETFCISCHEMEDTVWPEYKETVHYNNRSGVRATCPDCHVPKPWIHKMVRKIKASNELWHKALGSISTPEKFEAKRLQLAENVWKAMEDTDSRECRNCHNFEFMDFTIQEPRAAKRHDEAITKGLTCINCHKGIAHHLPEGAYGDEQKLSKN